MPARFYPGALLTISTLAHAYFWIQVLLNATGAYHFVLVGVFTELLTIPCLLALAVGAVLLPVYLYRGWLRGRQRLIAWLLLASTAALVVIAARL
ncbi:hypothetical protein EPD60_12305 [Flaviaesturariibacter flavus]|uniref:Uncharacterized protein n=1 Tax=Flaviaesturariibacter flavus TaxID=2502780 RepID=A0A4R1B9J4_9BACT|nr:hypothetical protein [Flaviaesturariibacter flavus]TCJ13573.1 hypothetical protein EPD60_12305 [Flaviaesturariibacter flavus]